jgi:hypothetical protein
MAAIYSRPLFFGLEHCYSRLNDALSKQHNASQTTNLTIQKGM